MAWINLDRKQKSNFRKLQKAFSDRKLWVGFADSDPRTACNLVAEDDGGDQTTEDNGDLADFVYDGEGDPEAIADSYAEEIEVYDECQRNNPLTIYRRP